MLSTTKTGHGDDIAVSVAPRALQPIPVVTTADLHSQLEVAAARGDSDTYHAILVQLPVGMQPIGVDGDLIVYGEAR
jgi:hypothetical protein